MGQPNSPLSVEDQDMLGRPVSEGVGNRRHCLWIADPCRSDPNASVAAKRLQLKKLTLRTWPAGARVAHPVETVETGRHEQPE
jgi:hypothetical protein